jgi:hypothetical protein
MSVMLRRSTTCPSRTRNHPIPVHSSRRPGGRHAEERSSVCRGRPEAHGDGVALGDGPLDHHVEVRHRGASLTYSFSVLIAADGVSLVSQVDIVGRDQLVEGLEVSAVDYVLDQAANDLPVPSMLMKRSSRCARATVVRHSLTEASGRSSGSSEPAPSNWLDRRSPLRTAPFCRQRSVSRRAGALPPWTTTES